MDVTKNAGTQEHSMEEDGPEVHGDAGRAERRRRGALLVTGGVLLVAVVSTVGALGIGGGGGDDGKAPGRTGQVVRVTRATMTDQTEIDGQLGHGPEVPFPVKADGTVTRLPATGSVVRRGGSVLRVNDRPVVLLYGSLPMYRELGVMQASGTEATGNTQTGAEGTSGARTRDDDTAKGGDGSTAPSPPPAGASAGRATPLHGMDVEQFEANLSALGYSGFTVDESYTELTANAVKRWQKDLGLPQTGRVGVGDVVYAPGPVRIAGTGVRLGDAASAGPVSYTSTHRMVTVNARADETGWAQRGSRVTVDLPDGHSVQGTVASLGSDAAASDGGDAGAGDKGTGGGSDGKAATVAVVITFDDQASLGRLQSGPVTVRYTVKQRKNVLTVPVAALTALAEGGYGLELADPENGTRDDGSGGGPGRFVAVRTGMFADGKVEVSGPGLREGMKVRIPE
ncbi:peptidoglycan-binding protein [Streptomyces sp. NPDC001276]|uniref:peptidoglycan-binding protein n=1 Tax=Streptomyces sp. NPDC001276 TaxID=3364555 RepID=UPI0036BAF02E